MVATLGTKSTSESPISVRGVLGWNNTAVIGGQQCTINSIDYCMYIFKIFHVVKLIYFYFQRKYSGEFRRQCVNCKQSMWYCAIYRPLRWICSHLPFCGFAATWEGWDKAKRWHHNAFSLLVTTFTIIFMSPAFYSKAASYTATQLFRLD